MTCEEVEGVLAAAALGERDDARLARARAHAAQCPRCAAVERECAEDAALLAVAAEPVSPPARLRRRIAAAVWREAQAAAPRGWWGPLRIAAAALSAAALVAAGVGVGASLRSAAPPVRIATAAVRATLSAPAVNGTVSYDAASQTLVVAVRGLADAPRTASGAPATYALWLVRSNNAVLAAGVLQAQPDGSWRAAMMRPVSGFTAVAATLETSPPGSAPAGPQLFQAGIPTG